MITLQTNYGDIKIQLDLENTPKTAENFLSYAKSGFYNGTIFHRVIENFMIQGGGFTPEMEKKESDAVIANEAEHALANKRGTVAMARTSDPHSASSQFFINVRDNDFLNYKSSNSDDAWGYCVFANVVEGMDVVDKIKAVAIGRQAFHQDVPVEAVVIETVTVEE